MRIKILSAAEDDLEEGHRFYEAQADGLYQASGVLQWQTTHSNLTTSA